MPWTIKQTRNGWQAEDKVNDRSISAHTREELDRAIAQFEGVIAAIANPAPVKNIWEMTDEEYAELVEQERERQRNHIRAESRTTAEELYFHWTGKQLPGSHYQPVTPQQETIQHKFERYHRNNPHVYQLLVARARRLVADGAKKIAISHLVENFRWEDDVLLAGTEQFKISNDFRSRYARLIMEQEPDLRGVFEVRELTSA